jgi:hypothetical protein
MKALRKLAVFIVGLFSLAAINTQSAIRYVDASNANPIAPYTNWPSAAPTIQDAVDVANSGDTILVTNGIYQTGARVARGRVPNRLAVTKPLTIQSVNGPTVTCIQGYRAPGITNGDDAIRCVYLTNNASLVGFRLTQGGTHSTGDSILEESGGAAWCESVSAILFNCALDDNSAFFAAGGVYNGSVINCSISSNSAVWLGGGAYKGILLNSTLTGNLANEGGGADRATLYYCTLSSNTVVYGDPDTAAYGGGAAYSTLNNCTIAGNSSPNYGAGAAACTLTNCLLTSNLCGLEGGGAIDSTLDNCSLSYNKAYQGAGTSWCTLNNCTLLQNSATRGGGALAGILNNCVLVSNQVQYSWAYDAVGGGAAGATLNNCTLAGNSAGLGGGVNDCNLTNCTLAANSALLYGGGAYKSRLCNSIIYYNASPNGPNNYFCALSNCCSTIDDGGSAITNEPTFVDLNGFDFHLQSNSPCINAGNNAYASTTNDLDGHPRVVGGTVDIGAYEYQTPTSVISYAWLQKYNLPIDGSADFTDSDNDGMNNWSEWIAGTDPTNPLSALRMLTPITSPNGLALRWQSVCGITYFLQRKTNVRGNPQFSTIQSNIVAESDITTVTDASSTNKSSYFYRVGIQSGQ